MFLRQFLSFLLVTFLACSLSPAQITQNLRGKVVDLDSKSPLAGATVKIFKDSTLINGAYTDEDGLFRIEGVEIGRYTVVVSYIGFQDEVRPDIIVNSGKEVVLNLELEESFTEVEGVEITASQKSGSLNEMATVSARTFSVEESERYAGSRGDPARMAANFAGVQGSDDSRNDIVIRGNSPFGVLWRLENVNIPNPNHFSIPASTGGPVSVLNNKVLSNSDFMTGAFPSEYGNALAGVFDLRMKNGNDEKHEFTGQFGLLGTELTAEGPVNRDSRASYLVNYRYSTLVLFGFLGLNLGTDAIPRYQDMSFKLNFPLKNGDNVSVFGIGGLSGIDITVSDKLEDGGREIYGYGDRDEYFKTRMGVAGINYIKTLSEKTFARFTVAASTETQDADHDLVFRHRNVDSLWVVDSLKHNMSYNFTTHRISFNPVLNTKLNNRNTIRTGIYGDLFLYDMVDSILDPLSWTYRHRMGHNSTNVLLQPFVQWKHRITENVTLNTGMNTQFFSLTNSFALEPRLGLKWKFAAQQSLSFGTGLHSQVQPAYVYFLNDDSSGLKENIDLDFSRSYHNVITYDLGLGRNLRLRAEAYYQYLYNIPVDSTPTSFSLINEGSGFGRFFPDPLVNEGTGKNYGLEVTLEKSFSKSYFFMLSGSLYNSTYKASDGNTYNSSFNGNYVLNALSTKEFSWGNKNQSSLGIGGKVTWAGGKRYSPIDTVLSAATGEPEPIDSLRNSLQFRSYFRADLKINYKLNTQKLTHEIGLDLVNILGTQNLLRLQYVGGPDPVREVYQLGFLPIFYYRIDF